MGKLSLPKPVYPSLTYYIKPPSMVKGKAHRKRISGAEDPEDEHFCLSDKPMLTTILHI